MPELVRHSIHKDDRSETGLAFYCHKEDWRFAVRDYDFFCYCPACGADARGDTLDPKTGLFIINPERPPVRPTRPSS